MKIHVKTVLWTFVSTFIISQLIAGLTDWRIVDPLLSRFGPSKATIEPVKWPLFHDGKTWIRTNIRNDGLKTLKGMNAEYLLSCEMEKPSKANLHKETLKKEEADYFEFAAALDTNCSISTKPFTLKFYKDDKTGLCYVESSKELTSSVCSWCYLNVTVYENFKEKAKISYPYPFSLGNITVSGGESNCLDITQASNPEDLTVIISGKSRIYAFCPGCIRGDITDKEWCQNNCVYS